MHSVQGQLAATVAGSCERGTGKTLCCLFEVNSKSTFPPFITSEWSSKSWWRSPDAGRKCPREDLRMRCSELYTPDEDQLQVSGVYLATKRLLGSEVV